MKFLEIDLTGPYLQVGQDLKIVSDDGLLRFFYASGFGLCSPDGPA